MILSKEIEVILNSANMKYFSTLGYENLKSGNKLIIPVEYLTKGSHSIVRVKCDVCGEEKDLVYRYYIKSLKNQNFYVCCSKCARAKAKETSVRKFGYEYYSQTETHKEKSKETCFEKYGVENPSQFDVFKEKRKNTMIERHGVEYYVLSDEFKGKSEKTSLVNYGTLHPMMSEKMKPIREAYYLKMGYNILTDKFNLYKRRVYYLTKKVKNDLINMWDGNDYYDGEYIRDNFDLPYYDGNYPTVDHKITIFQGFKDEIDAEKIADISNLCFTKRTINSKKHIKIEKDFII